MPKNNLNLLSRMWLKQEIINKEATIKEMYELYSTSFVNSSDEEVELIANTIIENTRELIKLKKKLTESENQ